MAGIVLEIKNITLKRSGKIVLDRVSLTIQRGEVLAIIGPSGGGKSSLLRSINRLQQIQSGQIMFDGEDIATLPVLDLRRRIGMVFQKTAVFEGSIADNIAYGPQLRGCRLTRDEIFALMSQAALEAELIDRDAQQLSGGQEQRLAVARALANQPQVLLLDEPTSALDPIATHKIEEALLNIREKHELTLIWVSHAVEQARRVADRVLLLEAGQVVRLGTTDELLNAESGDARALAFAQGIENDTQQEAR